MLYNSREEIESKYKWHVNDIFKTDDAWEELYFSVDENMLNISKYQDRLKDKDTILECLQFDSKTNYNIEKLYAYSFLKHDEDATNAKYTAMISKVEMLFVKYSSAASYIVPELSELSIEYLYDLSKDKDFKNFDVMLNKIIKDKNLILSKKEEKLISEMGMFSSTNQDVFNMFDDADIKFDPVKDDNGNDIELSHGTYGLLLQSEKQEVRKAAFESMFNAYKDHINMLAANYLGNVKKDWFYAKIRGFQSTLDSAMYNEDVPSTCYKKLLEAVGEGTKPLHEYMALRKKILGVETLNMYDLHCPLFKEAKLALPYEKAVNLVKDALKVMGKEYSGILAGAFENGWVDVCESKGKRSGAYSLGVYGVHPYVLLNYQETVHEIFTIAHEFGHAMHSYFSSTNQPYEKEQYTIFVAEIASTCNEVLLLKYLLKTATGDLRKYLLSYYLDMFRTTLFRQTMFSEFEAYAHDCVEKNEPFTADSLNDEYYKLNKKYYGDAVEHNDLIKYEWARIPHFYRSFYVYKYATGLTAAVSIADNILEQGEAYFEKYKKFLSAGCSLPPLDILRLADVDLETDAPYKKAMKEFADTLEELKKLY